MKQLLMILQDGKILTSSIIAEEVHLSEKTVRLRLKLLSEDIKMHGAELIAKPGSGFQLEIMNSQLFNEWMHSSNQQEIPTTSKERTQFLLQYLLEYDDYVKLDDLKQLLYVSRNTITADLKQVEYILTIYHLKVERRPNYGIKIRGTELNKRLCIANCLFKHNMTQVVLPNEKAKCQTLTDLISNIAKKYHLTMSENSFENLIVHTFIMNDRIQKEQMIEYSDAAKEEIYQLVKGQTIGIAEELSELIKSAFSIHYNEDEILYLALHLSGKATSDQHGKYGENLVISSKIDELVLHMLSVVYEEMRIDFTKNLELRMSLNQHMVPFDIRMRYNIPLKNPILEKIKTDYAFAYTVAAHATTSLKNYYNKEIPEDEIGYLAILFALAMEQRDKEIKKHNIIVVCASGRGTSQLFMFRYKQAFGKYINKIVEMTIFDLESCDFKGLEIDYVFTTIPINFKLPVPIYEVSLFLDSKEIDNYQRIFESKDINFMNNYFSQPLFIPCLKAKNKEEALRKICEFAQTKKKLPNQFYESVIKREQMGQTDFGNLVAIPHPYQMISEEKFVVATILENPVWWGHNEVQVVFLISLNDEISQDIEDFYRVITNYLSSLDLVKKTIEKREFSNLLFQLEMANKK